MNIDDLTIREAKEIAKIFSGSTALSILDDAIGQYAIVRTRNEGLNAGKLLAADETGCVIEDARRLWRSKPADSNLSWYEGVAVSGLHESSKVSGAVSRKYIIEDYSITICSKAAERSIRKAVSNES